MNFFMNAFMKTRVSSSGMAMTRPRGGLAATTEQGLDASCRPRGTRMLQRAFDRLSGMDSEAVPPTADSCPSIGDLWIQRSPSVGFAA
ncbi:hypothetical protein [Nevskia sp.]|uniref:hypothetical protein n=1 Tax=Nevskia sp. TaxID=1929292 RepID=UPI0025F08D63|nr:hypothetical protein [Nevskia sp.]